MLLTRHLICFVCVATGLLKAASVRDHSSDASPSTSAGLMEQDQPSNKLREKRNIFNRSGARDALELNPASSKGTFTKSDHETLFYPGYLTRETSINKHSDSFKRVSHPTEKTYSDAESNNAEKFMKIGKTGRNLNLEGYNIAPYRMSPRNRMMKSSDEKVLILIPTSDDDYSMYGRAPPRIASDSQLEYEYIPVLISDDGHVMQYPSDADQHNTYPIKKETLDDYLGTMHKSASPTSAIYKEGDQVHIMMHSPMPAYKNPYGHQREPVSILNIVKIESIDFNEKKRVSQPDCNEEKSKPGQMTATKVEVAVPAPAPPAEIKTPTSYIHASTSAPSPAPTPAPAPVQEPEIKPYISYVLASTPAPAPTPSPAPVNVPEKTQMGYAHAEVPATTTAPAPSPTPVPVSVPASEVKTLMIYTHAAAPTLTSAPTHAQEIKTSSINSYAVAVPAPASTSTPAPAPTPAPVPTPVIKTVMGYTHTAAPSPAPTPEPIPVQAPEMKPYMSYAHVSASAPASTPAPPPASTPAPPPVHASKTKTLMGYAHAEVPATTPASAPDPAPTSTLAPVVPVPEIKTLMSYAHAVVQAPAPAPVQAPEIKSPMNYVVVTAPAPVPAPETKITTGHEQVPTPAPITPAYSVPASPMAHSYSVAPAPSIGGYYSIPPALTPVAPVPDSSSMGYYSIPPALTPVAPAPAPLHPYMPASTVALPSVSASKVVSSTSRPFHLDNPTTTPVVSAIPQSEQGVQPVSYNNNQPKQAMPNLEISNVNAGVSSVNKNPNNYPTIETNVPNVVINGKDSSKPSPPKSEKLKEYFKNLAKKNSGESTPPKPNYMPPLPRYRLNRGRGMRRGRTNRLPITARKYRDAKDEYSFLYVPNQGTVVARRK